MGTAAICIGAALALDGRDDLPDERRAVSVMTDAHAPPQGIEGFVPPSAPSRSITAIPSISDVPIKIQVVEAHTQMPVEGAILVDGIPSERILMHDLSQVIGIADVQGRIQVSSAHLASLSGHDLWLAAMSFMPARLESDQLSDGEETVLLTRGYDLIVECSDVQGRPIAKCRVLASQAQLPPHSERSSYHSAANVAGVGKGGIGCAIADDRGIATLQGLSPGKYLFSGAQDGYALVGLTPSGVATIPSDSSVALTFARIGAAVFDAVDDEILSYAIQHPSHQHNSRSWADLQRESQKLQVAFPKSCFAVYVMDGQWQDVPASAKILLRDRGMVEAYVPVIPVDEISQPSMVNLASYRLTDQVCYPTPVRIRDAHGSAVPIELSFFLVVEDGMRILLEEGIKPFPAGKYRIECNDNRLQETFEPHEAVIPGEINIGLHRSLRPCRIDVLDEDGRRYGRFVLYSTYAGRTNFHSILDDDGVHLLFAPGRTMFTAKVWGFEDTTIEAEVTPGFEPQHIRILLNQQHQ